MESAPLISVVVPTYLRPDLLERCVLALARQSLDPKLYEIIVVDDARSKQTEEQVKRLRAQCEPRLIYLPNLGRRGPAAARNVGWRASSSSIIAFTDDDTIPDGDWLRAGLEGMNDPKVIAARGRVIVPLPSHPTDYERDAAGLAHAEFVTANCFCSKSALEVIGGFDEQFSMAWREDSDLFFNLLKYAVGKRPQCQIKTLPKAIVVHPIRSGRWGISVSQQRKSMFNALLYKKHPDLYRTRIQALPPVRYYLAVGSLLGGLILGALGSEKGLSLFCSMWMFITVEFTWKRLRETSREVSHIVEMFVTSILIPPLSIYWRIRGALRFQVFFV